MFRNFRRFVYELVQFTLQRPKEGKNNPKMLSFAPFYLFPKKKVHF